MGIVDVWQLVDDSSARTVWPQKMRSATKSSVAVVTAVKVFMIECPDLVKEIVRFVQWVVVVITASGLSLKLRELL